MRFFLGSHRPHWLSQTDIALFISDRQLRRYKTLPRALGPWALDSGGFTELSTQGSWAHGPSPAEYVMRVRRYADEIGGLVFAAPQDWMCEPAILHGGQFAGTRFAGTGLTVGEHQRRTVENFLELRELAPDLPFIPVLQGWSTSDYLLRTNLAEVRWRPRALGEQTQRLSQLSEVGARPTMLTLDRRMPESRLPSEKGAAAERECWSALATDEWRQLHHRFRESRDLLGDHHAAERTSATSCRLRSPYGVRPRGLKTARTIAATRTTAAAAPWTTKVGARRSSSVEAGRAAIVA